MFVQKTNRRAFVSFLSLFGLSTATSFAAGPVISYDPESGGVLLVQKRDVGGEVASQIVVKAKGAREVAAQYGNMNGVLFQATASPVDRIKSLPLKLSYKPKGNHEAVLCMTIGQDEVTSDVPAWVWVVAAKFAHHEATGALTMTDVPQTPAEKRFARRWRRDSGSGQRLVWARYHPAVDDTLIGFFLVAADAMMGDAQHMRTLPNGLVRFRKISGYPMKSDGEKSSRAARTLDGIIGLEAKPGDCVMLNDIDDSFVFDVDDNHKLRISGEHRYHFARKIETEVYEEASKLTSIFGKNPHVYLDVNPLVHQVVADFGKLVAFFNYVEETNPDHFDAFVNQLTPLFDRIPTIDTPIAVPLVVR